MDLLLEEECMSGFFCSMLQYNFGTLQMKWEPGHGFVNLSGTHVFQEGEGFQPANMQPVILYHCFQKWL